VLIAGGHRFRWVGFGWIDEGPVGPRYNLKDAPKAKPKKKLSKSQ
jgi:hypothetical protein